MSFLGQVFPNQEILADRYQLKNIIGKGGMGTVYEAADTLLGGVKLAIKFLLHHTVDQKMKDSFLNEAKICALLGNKSINIVKVIDYGLWNGDSPYSLPSLRLLIANRLESLLLEDLAWVFFLWEGSIM